MTSLHEWLARQNKHQCDWCGVALVLALIALGLIAALHFGGEK